MKKFKLKDENYNTDYQYEGNKNFEDSLKTLMLYSGGILGGILTIFIANYESIKLIQINSSILILIMICLLLSFISALLGKFLLTFLAYSLHDFGIIKENIDEIESYSKYVEKLAQNKKQLDIINQEVSNLEKITKGFKHKIKQGISTRLRISVCFATSLIGFIAGIILLTYLFFEIIK